MTNIHEKYEEWLVTIANTRLIYNTMDELEAFFENYSIHNNGIRRCFPTFQKQRSAFRDLATEVQLMTDGDFNLVDILQEYQKAWTFFRENLNRRAKPEKVALELLEYCYPPYQRKNCPAKRQEIYTKMEEQGIQPAFLVLLLLKALPGYDSKEGDVTDIHALYERVLDVLQQFTSYLSLFETLPAILRARESDNKSRIMLLYHSWTILELYRSYADKDYFYDIADTMHSQTVDLDLEGYWNICGGGSSTDFWEIEHALEEGAYFFTHWHKCADKSLSCIRYTAYVFTTSYGNYSFYLCHPKTMKRTIQGKALGDADHVWYETEALPQTPSELPLRRLLSSNHWPLDIRLSRCTDRQLTEQYDKWLNSDSDYTITNEFKEYEYLYTHNLYAITAEHLYIRKREEEVYYKVPKKIHSGMERIQFSDMVGILTMKDKTYLAFSDLQVYINTTTRELQKYDIELVTTIQ